MVWFQCDDCGDNVKKPKLANHFRCCRAGSLSCIDCGAVFNRQSVQQHTQCVSEAEKYGPKGAAAKSNGGAAASNPNAAAEAPMEEVTMGLSTRPPWLCSLCNVKATGKETLVVHGQSKRHRAKARAAIAASKPETPAKPSEVVEAEQGNKRKRGAGADSTDQDQAKLKIETEIGNGKLEGEQKKKKIVVKMDEPAAGLIKSVGIESANGKQKPDAADLLKVVKWRKLISGLLKKTPDGTLKKKKLEKAVLPMAIEVVTNAGLVADASVLKSELRTYLESSSRFVVNGKFIQLTLKKE